MNLIENEIFYKNEKVDTIDKLIGKFNHKEFKSPFRSTIPLLILYKIQPNTSFGIIENNMSAKYYFEFELKVKKGKGRASCTDLMIKYPNTCIAIEVKRTEPPYIKTGKWINNSNRDNRKLVLEGWIKTISDYTGINFNLESISDLPYQLIHRVASACHLNKLETHVVYLCFDLDEVKRKYYSDILHTFSEVLGKKINFYLALFKIEKLDKQIEYELSWTNKSVRDLSPQIIQGLKDNSLMTLSQLNIEKIDKSN